MNHRIGLTTAVAAVALLTMTGCGSETITSDAHPGAAAVVGDETIKVSEVDDLARAYCDFVAPQMESADQAVPMSLVRNASLGLLVSQQIAEQYAEEMDLDIAAAKNLLRQQAEQQAAQAQVADSDLDIYYQVSVQLPTQSIYLAAGGEDAFAQGTLPAQDAVQVGSAMVQEWAKGLTVDYDPKFADLAAEKYDVNGETLSLPVSELAELAATFDPAAAADPDYLAALPASQKCG